VAQLFSLGGIAHHHENYRQYFVALETLFSFGVLLLGVGLLWMRGDAWLFSQKLRGRLERDISKSTSRILDRPDDVATWGGIL
jgi:hypothetical protein